VDEVREQYLNLLPLIPGLLELRCACQLTCVVAGFFMDATQDIARRYVGATARLEFARMAVARAKVEIGRARSLSSIGAALRVDGGVVETIA
jgi:hypothetical protein